MQTLFCKHIISQWHRKSQRAAQWHPLGGDQEGGSDQLAMVPSLYAEPCEITRSITEGGRKEGSPLTHCGAWTTNHEMLHLMPDDRTAEMWGRINTDQQYTMPSSDYRNHARGEGPCQRGGAMSEGRGRAREDATMRATDVWSPSHILTMLYTFSFEYFKSLNCTNSFTVLVCYYWNNVQHVTYFKIFVCLELHKLIHCLIS